MTALRRNRHHHLHAPHTSRRQQARRRRHNPAALIAAAGLAFRCDTEGKGPDDRPDLRGLVRDAGRL
eukprot:jgi/Tetstr1/457879/TSEL_044400.t1